MRKATVILLWCFVCSLAWERVSLPLIGRAPVLLGPVVMGLGVLTTLVEGRVRRIGAVVGLAIAFAFSAVFSTLWAVSLEPALQRVATYAQLVGLVWLVWEFARTPRAQQALLIAYVLGMFVPIAALIVNYASGQTTNDYGVARYSALGLNADELGLMCALSLPMAWRLILGFGGGVRLMASMFLLVAPVGVMLTGTRGSFVVALVGLSIIPISLRRSSGRVAIGSLVVLILSAVVVAQVVPSDSWARMGTIGQELGDGGSLTGRREIWAGGWQVFLARPLLGVGAGGFETAVYPMLSQYSAPHNTLLAILVEQGVLGFLIFAALVLACAGTCRRLAPREREFWVIMLLAWLVGGTTLHWQYHKLTWLLFGLLAAEAAASSAASRKMGADAVLVNPRSPVLRSGPLQDDAPLTAPMTAQYLRPGR